MNICKPLVVKGATATGREKDNFMQEEFFKMDGDWREDRPGDHNLMAVA